MLLGKVDSYGVRSSANMWFKSYLINRTHILSVYHPRVFTKLNKMVFTSQTHLFSVCLTGKDHFIEIEHSLLKCLKLIEVITLDVDFHFYLG